MSEYQQYEIGVRATTVGFYGFIVKTEGKEEIYKSIRYDDFNSAMNDSMNVWHGMKK